MSASDLPPATTALPGGTGSPVPARFPVPRRATDTEDHSPPAAARASRGLLVLVTTAAAMAGFAAWVSLRPPPPASLPPAAVAPLPPPPPDETALIYLSGNPEPSPPPAGPSPEVAAAAESPVPEAPLPLPEEPPPAETPPEPPAAPAPDAATFHIEEEPPPHSEMPAEIPAGENPAAEPPAAAPVESGPLEEKYLTALLRASASAAAEDVPAWTAEIERIKSGSALPPPGTARPAELQRLRMIYQREKEKQARESPAAAPTGVREIELFTMADDAVDLLLNGVPVPVEKGAVQKTVLKLKPGDVLGFHCTSGGGFRSFAAVARTGVQWLFSTSDRWEAATEPGEGWFKGEGPSGARPRVLRGRVEYSMSAAEQFESAARTGPSGYKVLWAGNGNTCAFRYRIRPVDLPEKKVVR